MALVNKKTRKAIRKGIKKALRKHGPEIAAGLVAAVASTLATLATTVSPESNGRRSNLTELAREVSDRVGGGSSNKEKKSDRPAPERIAARRRSERDDLRGRGDDADDIQGHGGDRHDFSGRSDGPGGREV